MQVCAVSAIGFAEGPSHTNWKKVATILLWWFVGFFCVCGATYVLVAQGAVISLLLLCSFLLLAHRAVFFALRMMCFLLFLVPLLPFSVLLLFLMLLLSCCLVWLGTAALAS